MLRKLYYGDILDIYFDEMKHEIKVVTASCLALSLKQKREKYFLFQLFSLIFFLFF